MSKENNAKNVVVMNPAIWRGSGKFNFVIAAKHDNLKSRKNIITTTLAPNLIDAKELESAGKKLKERIDLKKNKIVGLLIGGNNPEFTLSPNVLKRIVSETLKFCEANDAELLVTTSRRTGGALEAILKKILNKQPRCKLLVIANENNPPDTLSGILALSDIVVVSCESISMISEAINSGKHSSLKRSEARLKSTSARFGCLRPMGISPLQRPEISPLSSIAFRKIIHP
jgi:uncharacterized protein